jgi:MYXO-CTERM domain-containing protein
MLALLLTLGAAIAAPGPGCGTVSESIEVVRSKGREAAYRCLADDDEAGAPLLAWLRRDGVEPPGDRSGEERVQRALALHVMQRLGAPVDVPALRGVGAADRRLLRDAVHARRGRRSPAPAHERVFSKFDWYQPDDGFSNARLTQLDRENLEIIDAPPKPVPVPAPEAAEEPASAAVVNEAPPAAAQVESWCGCASGQGTTGAVGLALALVPLVVRRRQTPCG